MLHAQAKRNFQIILLSIWSASVTVSVSCDFDELCFQLNTESQVRAFLHNLLLWCSWYHYFLIQCKDPK